MSRPARAGRPTSFGAEARDLVRFLLRPRPGPRLPGRRPAASIRADFSFRLPWLRLLQWALLLWAVNLVIFAPLALSAAEAAGAQHRLNIYNLPWLTALIWAPIVEELAFRYFLRRPAVWWWFVPLLALLMFNGPGPVTGLLVFTAVLLAFAPHWYSGNHAWRWACALDAHRLRWVANIYPLLFHLVALVFAAVHLFNFRMTGMSLFLLPLLVMPQWVTGLVLGWMRVRRGIGASIALHMIFNAGPLLLIGLVLRLAPELAAS